MLVHEACEDFQDHDWNRGTSFEWGLLLSNPSYQDHLPLMKIILTYADLLKHGAPSGTRTPNPLIKSQLLCQLS